MRIFIVAGGTGGHLFPAISLAEEIRLKGAGEVLFVTSSRRQDRAILEKNSITFHTLPVIPLQSKKVLPILNFVARLLAGTVKSGFLLLHFRPSAVIGFGGYISGPILLLAAFFRIKTIIHEQNVYPGKTNRILSRFVDKIAISFPQTKEYLKKFESKIILSGNPLRRELKKSQKTVDVSTPSDSKYLMDFTVLAIGGSQGAHALNRFIPEAVGLIEDTKKSSLEVIHISGYEEKDKVIRAYQDKGVRSKVISFTEEIYKFYKESDFVIARAGATTVSELLYLAKPSILIPYPHGKGHQRLNAKILEDMGIAILLEEKGLTVEDLRDAIIRLMDKNVLTSMSKKVEEANIKDASEILVNMISQIIAH